MLGIQEQLIERDRIDFSHMKIMPVQIINIVRIKIGCAENGKSSKMSKRRCRK